MRITRHLATGLALALLVPALAQAQEGRSFNDSWFWGLKASNLTYWTTRMSHGQAQGIGGETMITRTRAALLIGAEMFSFGDVYDLEDTEMSSIRGEPVEMKSMSRLSVTLLAFPKNIGGLRPYAGIGFAYNRIDASIPGGSRVSLGDLQDASMIISPTLMAGLQAQYRRFSVFGQGTFQASQANEFLLNNNQSYIVEGGIRFNFGRSIDDTL
jgi:opacity protein-like surface antigen